MKLLLIYLNYNMLPLFKSISKLKDNWPNKLSFNRKFFFKYFTDEQSNFLKNMEIKKPRLGHPEFLTYVKLNNENYFCTGNLSHSSIIITERGKKVGYDCNNKPVYFMIEDLRIKKVDFNNLGELVYDIVNNICKVDSQIFVKDSKQMQLNILSSIDIHFKSNGYTNYFLNYNVLDVESFAEETNLIIDELKNEIINIHKHD